MSLCLSKEVHMSTKHKMRFSFLAVAALVLMVPLTLVNCGGGGGGSASQPVYAHFLYVTNVNSNDVSIYKIDGSGGLVSLSTPTAAAGGQPVSVAIHPSGKFAYVVNKNGLGPGPNGYVSQYTVGSNGSLTSMSTPTIAAENWAVPVVVHPSGKFAYVANQGANTISEYSIAATGELTSSGTATTGTGPFSMAVDPAGKYAYVANQTANTVSEYTIDSTSGALVFAGTVIPGTGPISVAVDPFGKFVYVANFNTGNVSAYTINAANGSLVSAGTATAGTNPNSVTVDPTGKFVYVANFLSNDISAYTINASTGALTPIDADPITGGIQNFPAVFKPNSVVVDPSGKFAYVANFGTNNISAYSIDASTGVLTKINADPVGGMANISAGTGPYSMAIGVTVQ